MRYNLGYMDKYPIEAAGSTIENNPMYRVVFKDFIDPIKLEAATYKALDSYPLFKTFVQFDHEYYLRTNERPIIILNCKEEDRPNSFGRNTNGYPWRLIYHEKTICFEWLHGVSDGNGSLAFFSEIILSYFNYDLPKKSTNFLVAPGLEPFYDSKEKGINYKVDPKGFYIKDFPRIDRMYKTDCHSLVCDTDEIVKLAHLVHSSVTPVIAILFSQALRMHLPKNIKNRKVACNIVLDLRRPLKYETMHNCVDYKRITYLDEYDDMNFASVAKIYKGILDNARKIPNTIRSITDRVKTFKAYHLIGRRKFLKLCIKLIAFFMKESDCNFVVTYPGSIKFPEPVMNQIENMDLKIWHDFGECIIGAIDFKGRFNLNIHENFQTKGVVEDFIKLSKKVGIHWKYLGSSVFTQSTFVEDK